MFFLPLTVYLFFATGVNLFDKLPVVKENIEEINYFESENVSLEGNITVLGFLGKDVIAKRAIVYNLALKIYKPYYQFEDLQFVWIVSEENKEEVIQLKAALENISKIDKWNFVYGSDEEIISFFNQLHTDFNQLHTDENLDANYSSTQVYIIDKDKNLRGRNEVEETVGYDISTPAAINNKLRDDIKILLAEYRLALKKNNRYKREI